MPATKKIIRSTQLPHRYEEDGVCGFCGFRGTDWYRWRYHSREGMYSGVGLPECKISEAKEKEWWFE